GQALPIPHCDECAPSEYRPTWRQIDFRRGSCATARTIRRHRVSPTHSPQNMRTAAYANEAVKTDEPKHNIRDDAKWVHVDCPPIPQGPGGTRLCRLGCWRSARNAATCR